MATYNINGTTIAEMNTAVFVSTIKAEHPSYDDDAVLEEGIRLAKLAGPNTMIIWDGKAVNFSGSVSHECVGFGGIDFNGSRVIMPNYDGGTILSIRPESPTALTVSASDIGKRATTNASLAGKVFALNYGHQNDGAAGTCLGKRTMSGADYNVYYQPTVRANEDGTYVTGELFLVPTSGNVECGNIHAYPSVTFEVKNATVVSNAGSNMSVFIACTRSNTHIHNLVLEGRSGITTYHNGILTVSDCCDVQIDHISGVNPVQSANTTGYFVLLGHVVSARLSDLSVGDGDSWGAIGGNQLTNVTFERCCLNRIDSHYAQYGYIAVRECVVNELLYGIGSGVVSVENSIFVNNKTSNSDISMIGLRSDMVGVYAGNIIVRNTQFKNGLQPANKFVIWDDSCSWQWTGSSDAEYAPMAMRCLEKCIVPSGTKQLIKIGTSQTADKGMFANLGVMIRDMDFTCAGTMIDADLADQGADSISIRGCRFTATRITDKVYGVRLHIDGCSTGSANVRVAKNTGLIIVSGSDIGIVEADQASSVLTLTGCRVNGEQTFTQFSNYAAYGNVSGRGAQYTSGLNTCI